jgi:hypothetical protein
LREGSRAHAVRSARTCYDHLAGQLGTAIMAALIDQGVLAGGDGTFDSRDSGRDRLSSPGWDCDYRLTGTGQAWMDDFGVKIATGSRRPLVRYCVDWSEQRHHLAGSLGAAIATRMVDLGWVRKAQRSRAVHVSDDGVEGLREQFGVELGPSDGH